MRRRYMVAAVVAVLVAVAAVTPAFAAKAALTPDLRLVKCPDTGVFPTSPPLCGEVTLTNTSGSEIQELGWAIIGNNVDDFSYSGSSCGGAYLYPGDTCTLDVYFYPEATGHRSAIAVFAETSLGTTTSVRLSGRGT